jgi:hypothetical protein
MGALIPSSISAAISPELSRRGISSASSGIELA